MKTVASIVLAVLILLVVAAPAVQAQQTQNPSQIPPYFTYPYATSKQYANSQTDTLPQPTGAGVSTGIKLAATNLLSFTIVSGDSVTADVYADYRVRGSATWTQILADSIIGTTATIKEFPLRTATVDKIGGIDGDIRWRIAYRAAGNGNGGAPTNKKYSHRVSYKP